MLSLRDFTESDLATTHHCAEELGSGQYMSRYLPKGDSFPDMLQNTIAWKIIVVDSIDVGVIWLDKSAEANTSILGIMLFNASNFGLGIGRKAIEQLFIEMKSQGWFGDVCLNVRKTNVRAIKCYESLGFSESGAGDKRINGQTVSFVKMTKYLTI